MYHLFSMKLVDNKNRDPGGDAAVNLKTRNDAEVMPWKMPMRDHRLRFYLD
jgi:hypothetical protein